MISYSGSGKTFTFLTSIPGRQERRLVHGISARLTFRELKRKLCEVWEVNNADACVVSYGLYSLSMQVTVTTQEEWQHALDNDFFVASASNVAHQGKPILLELRRKTAPPSEAELFTPHDQLQQQMSKIVAAREQERATFESQSNELQRLRSALTTQNALLARHGYGPYGAQGQVQPQPQSQPQPQAPVSATQPQPGTTPFAFQLQRPHSADSRARKVPRTGLP